MPVTMTAREVKDEDIRKRAWARAAQVQQADPELATALRNLARDIGTEDERPGDVALLDEEALRRLAQVRGVDARRVAGMLAAARP